MDSEKIKQVFLNLLANALDFTPQGGKIDIITKQQLDKDNHHPTVLIEVTDNGVGIPPSDINNIFDPYFTTKHKSSMHKGTGLGLFIAYQHVQDHRGNIEAKSKVHEGTTFLITLPADSSS
jgi:signal transduction histidine kinase